MAKKQDTVDAAGEAQEFDTGVFISEKSLYDFAHGQQVREGEKQVVTFHEDVADEDAVVMLDDPKAVQAYMADVGAKAYTLSSKPFRLVGGAAVATRYKAVDARLRTR